MEQSQTTRTEDNASQSSKRKYTKFVPKEVSETGSKKKLSLEGSYTNLKNLVRTSSRSTNKMHMKNEQSIPNLLIRVDSQLSFGPKTTDSRQEFKPPLPHKVRFYEDIPASNNQSAEKEGVRNLEVSMAGTSNSFVSPCKLLPTDVRTEEFFNNHLDGLPRLADQRLEAKQNILITEIRRYRLLKEAYLTKLSQVKELYKDLSHMVQDSLAKYHLEMGIIINTFKGKFQRELQLLQSNLQAKASRATSIDTYFIPPPNTLRAPIAENISSNVSRLSEASDLESFRNDCSNSILGKLQRICVKLDKMGRYRQEFDEEQQPTNNIMSSNVHLKDSGLSLSKNVCQTTEEEQGLNERTAIIGKPD